MQTVFVLGAGASAELRLPTGKELTEKIASSLRIKTSTFNSVQSGDSLVLEALSALSAENGCQDIINEIQIANRISRGMPLAISIDNYIDNHRDDRMVAQVGKIGIAYQILKSERSSLLYTQKPRETGSQLSKLSGTWYVNFFKLITENCSLRDLEKRLREITLIIFNYDRCIEHFLIHALMTIYSLDESLAAEYVKKIDIFHPYGTVDKLPWQLEKGTATSFGEEVTGYRLYQLSRNIKTFTEGSDNESSELKDMRKQFRDAERICFLGFAFHPLNLRFLRSTWLDYELFPNERKRCFGTSLGISPSDIQIIKSELAEILKCERRHINLEDKTCADLFDYFWRSLSFAR